MLATLTALYVLAGLDTLFSGICAASGRNALIHKQAYYVRAMVFGFLWGQAACLVALVMLSLIAYLSADPDRTVAEMAAVGERMALVYLTYAGIVLCTFLVRAVPSVDVRSVTSVVGFGPLTMMRPAVIIIGIAWGLALRPSIPVAIAALLIGSIMVPFRVWLNRMLDWHGIDMLKPR